MITNFSWALRGNLVYAASQWLILVILAKLGSPEMIGQYALGLAITAPVMMFLNLQLRSLLVTDAKDQFLFGEYFALRLLTNILALVVVSMIVFAVGYALGPAMVIMLIGASKTLESCSDILHGLMQKGERLDLISVSQMIKGASSVLAFGLALYFSGSLAGAITALALAWLAVLVLVDSPNALRVLAMAPTADAVWNLLPRCENQRLQELIIRALPVGVVAMLISYNVTIPRYFLESYHGEAALGYFAALAYLPLAGTIVIEALGQSALPRLARYYVLEPSAYWRLLARLILFAGVLAASGLAVATVWGRPLLSLLYKPQYAEHFETLLAIMVSEGMLYVCAVLGGGLTAASRLKVQVPILVAVVMTNFVASWWLVPDRGEIGSAWALIMGSTAWMLASAGVLLRLYFGK